MHMSPKDTESLTVGNFESSHCDLMILPVLVKGCRTRTLNKRSFDILSFSCKSQINVVYPAAPIIHNIQVFADQIQQLILIMLRQ